MGSIDFMRGLLVSFTVTMNLHLKICLKEIRGWKPKTVHVEFVEITCIT